MKYSRFAILAFALLLAFLGGACDSMSRTPTEPPPQLESQDQGLPGRECPEGRTEDCIG